MKAHQSWCSSLVKVHRCLLQTKSWNNKSYFLKLIERSGIFLTFERSGKNIFKRRKKRGFVSFLHFTWFYKREEEDKEEEEEEVEEEAEECCNQETIFSLFIVSFVPIIYFIYNILHFSLMLLISYLVLLFVFVGLRVFHLFYRLLVDFF